MFQKHENVSGNSKQGYIPQVKDLVFLVIHMCQTVKTRESVGRRAKPVVRPRKFATHKMIRIKAQRIRDVGASRTFIRNIILIMENSYSGGCETLETPNIFIFPSVLSFITILIWSCFILERFISPSQSRSCFI